MKPYETKPPAIEFRNVFLSLDDQPILTDINFTLALGTFPQVRVDLLTAPMIENLMNHAFPVTSVGTPIALYPSSDLAVLKLVGRLERSFEQAFSAA